MKKFTKILICVLICVFCLGLAACKKNVVLFPMPAGEVEGNGGLVVKKGDYLYFVNGHQTASTSLSRNASYTLGALMVTKLDENGNPVLNEDELLDDSYYWIISSKLCGFQATGLYIFGEYLYFTSPSEEDDVHGSWAVDRVNFNRIKLNSNSDVETLYTTEVNNSNLQYNFYSDGTNVNLLIYEKGTNLDHGEISNRLLRVNLANKASVQTVATDVSSIVLTGVGQDDLGKHIFYVVNKDSKYQLKQYNVYTNSSTDFGSEQTKEPVLKFVGGNYVYYEMQNEDGNHKDFYRSNVSEADFKKLFNDSARFDNIYLLNDASRIIAIVDNAVACVDFAGNNLVSPRTILEDDDATEINVIGFQDNGNMIYYDNNNNVKVVNVAKSQQPNSTLTITTIATISDFINNSTEGCENDVKFDLDEHYLYFYKKVGSNNYLHRLALTNIFDDEKEEMIGVYLTADIPEKEETEETE